MQVRTLNEILDQLEDEGHLSEDDLLDAFSQWASQSGRPLYPHQEEALLELLAGNHVIAQTPTGSGKSLIALAGHFISLARGGRSYYTAPLKALVSEKFFDLVDQFGASNVGMVTGDVSLNADAPIICCTAEILANQSLREGAQLDADMVIMDEFHFYGDPQRGWAWQVPLLQLRKPQFVALSATLGDTTALRADLEKRTGRAVSEIADAVRPVPLEFEYCVDDLPTVVERLLKEDKAPIYIVHFAQAQAVETAVTLSKLTMIDKAKKETIAVHLAGTHFGRGFGQVLRRLLAQGIGIHHAGMLPRYRRLVERLAQSGLLAVICGTDTLGVGINVPIRTVLFTALVKYDGRRTRHLSAREFHQIAGRAGRAGYDTVGYVRALASESEVEQAKRQARLSAAQEARDQKKLKKLAKSRAPKAQKGKVTWTAGTFERLAGAHPETLSSQFDINHALVLNVLSGPGDVEEELLRLARDNHSSTGDSNPYLRQLGDIYRSLKQAGIVSRDPKLRVSGDLPDEFALNQPLAPFALAALDLLDPSSEDFALDVLSVVEAIVEDPSPILYAQQRVARDQAMAAMKAEGREYADRMDAIQEVTWPKPLAEIIEPAFEVFAATNPWVGYLEPSPKSVVREMIETAATFSGYISRYDCTNSEGIFLRYLTDVYRAMGQILQAQFHTDEVQRIIDWLGQLVRSVDSSLLDEWESLAAGKTPEAIVEPGGDDEVVFGEGSNPYAERRALRQRAFTIVELLANDNVDALSRLDPAWDFDRWDKALARYWAEHDWISIDQEARSPELFHVDGTRVEQTILDPAGDGDWRLIVDFDGDETQIIDFAPR
ncbi:DEAD/DEAH box helicase [Scrofimicrobium canadense]|uniref:DEAD/DEAH box helicase n=1 Tax=Scrofimicrobium canadense TaxID=2652290 RepID=UPI00384DC1C7